MIRVAHVWSTDIGLPSTLPYYQPLLDRGWEVTVICPPGPRVEAVVAAGLRWLPHPLRRQIHPPSDAAGLAILFRHFRSGGFHIVHTHNAKVGLFGRAAAQITGVPVVLHTHHGMVFSGETPWLPRWGLAALERAANLRVDRLLVQSEEDRATLLECHAVAAHRIEVLGNGVDLARFSAASIDRERRQQIRRALGVDEDAILFFSAGRLVREKGFVELFEAHRGARRRDARIRLAVAGPVDEERGLGVDAEVLVRATNDGVLLLGERSDMPELYSASDVVVLASWREGLPRVLMEGAAMGKPLLAADSRGCREVVRGGLGRLVPPRQPQALEDAMCEMAADPRGRARMAAANAVAARQRFDLGAVVARLENLYVDLLRDKGLLP